ncbi:hypothetical protein [Ectopseudomonas oleovorans]|uniref:Uncharacterized protein n=1 Tax=Ectopseudomonas oleovorans TaxID=301 RepID=A0A3D9EI18_ECTOL|nr:hypothetical protein [Pseudomonas oleovorans]RED02035.1 hypothetical protein DFO60_3660 [Pseudomonas oleovorans]
MSFVLDSEDWNLTHLDKNEVLEKIESLLDTLDRIAIREEKIWIGENFQSIKMHGDLAIWDLFSPYSGLDLPQEAVQELAGHLNKIAYYESEEVWPAGFEDLDQISVENGPPSENLDILWALSSVRNRNACACIGAFKKGKYSVASRGSNTYLHWIQDNNDQINFWRDAIEVQGDSPSMLQELSPHAYPDLYFPSSVWRGCNSFTGGYHSNSAELRRYLEIFNDFGNWVFTAPPPAEIPTDSVDSEKSSFEPTSKLIERRFTLLNITVTPENPNVYHDNTCRRARTLNIQGREIYCEWHGKIQGRINRVHIHRPIPESQDKLIIAFITDHLPLP